MDYPVETETYHAERSVEDGIERIVYRPALPRFETPVLLQHGMWHGAWCWEPWQKFLAERGWESHAFSLPGHAGSPEQRPIRWCTMGYYLKFLKAEVGRLDRKPILMGHSMGGALAQWYLKKLADDLPAAVLVASWTSHSTFGDGLIPLMSRDFWGAMMIFATLSGNPFVRSPERAAQTLITEGALLTPEELHSKLGPETALGLNQHNPPFWSPPRNIGTPLLWVAAGRDATITTKGARASAEFYGADFICIDDDGHNLMMERNYLDTITQIENWFADREIP